MSHNLFHQHHSAGQFGDALLGFKQIFYTPLISAMIVLIMSFALFLTIMFYLLWDSKDLVHNKWNESAQITLYLKKKLDIKLATQLVEALQKNTVVAKAELIPPQQGIKAFAETSALNILLASFKENPLPYVITINPKVNLLAKNTTQNFLQELRNQTIVDTVKADSVWIERSYNWLNLWDSLSLIFILVLSINCFLIITGVCYIAGKYFIAKSHVTTEVLSYKFVWLVLISNLLALILTRAATNILQNQDILIPRLCFGCRFILVFGSLLLGFFSSRIAAYKD